MEEIYKKARAKINLSLIVGNKRADNYHNIKSIFQKINLYDEIYIQKTNTGDFELETNVEELNNQENIMYKAYSQLREKYAISGIKVILNKKIPMQAGLAGGSTDCASFILAMNELFDLKLSKKEIESFGKNLGADVVPCLYQGAVLAEGIGEKITKIRSKLKYYVLIIKPQLSCSTKEMFQKLDEKNEIRQIDTSAEIIQALECEDVKLLADHLYNVFEDTIQEKDFMKKIKSELLQNGAVGSLLTGTGACVYGIFDKKETVKSAYQILRNQYEVYIATSYHSKRRDLF